MSNIFSIIGGAAGAGLGTLVGNPMGGLKLGLTAGSIIDASTQKPEKRKENLERATKKGQIVDGDEIPIIAGSGYFPAYIYKKKLEEENGDTYRALFSLGILLDKTTSVILDDNSANLNVDSTGEVLIYKENCSVDFIENPFFYIYNSDTDASYFASDYLEDLSEYAPYMYSTRNQKVNADLDTYTHFYYNEANNTINFLKLTKNDELISSDFVFAWTNNNGEDLPISNVDAYSPFISGQFPDSQETFYLSQFFDNTLNIVIYQEGQGKFYYSNSDTGKYCSEASYDGTNWNFTEEDTGFSPSTNTKTLQCISAEAGIYSNLLNAIGNITDVENVEGYIGASFLSLDDGSAIRYFVELNFFILDEAIKSGNWNGRLAPVRIVSKEVTSLVDQTGRPDKIEFLYNVDADFDSEFQIRLLNINSTMLTISDVEFDLFYNSESANTIDFKRFKTDSVAIDSSIQSYLDTVEKRKRFDIIKHEISEQSFGTSNSYEDYVFSLMTYDEDSGVYSNLQTNLFKIENHTLVEYNIQRNIKQDISFQTILEKYAELAGLESSQYDFSAAGDLYVKGLFHQNQKNIKSLIDNVIQYTNLTITEQEGQIKVYSPNPANGNVKNITKDSIGFGDGAKIEYSRESIAELPQRVTVSFFNSLKNQNYAKKKDFVETMIHENEDAEDKTEIVVPYIQSEQKALQNTINVANSLVRELTKAKFTTGLQHIEYSVGDFFEYNNNVFKVVSAEIKKNRIEYETVFTQRNGVYEYPEEEEETVITPTKSAYFEMAQIGRYDRPCFYIAGRRYNSAGTWSGFEVSSAETGQEKDVVTGCSSFGKISSIEYTGGKKAIDASFRDENRKIKVNISVNCLPAEVDSETGLYDGSQLVAFGRSTTEASEYIIAAYKKLAFVQDVYNVAGALVAKQYEISGFLWGLYGTEKYKTNFGENVLLFSAAEDSVAKIIPKDSEYDSIEGIYRSEVSTIDAEYTETREDRYTREGKRNNPVCATTVFPISDAWLIRWFVVPRFNHNSMKNEDENNVRGSNEYTFRFRVWGYKSEAEDILYTSPVRTTAFVLDALEIPNFEYTNAMLQEDFGISDLKSIYSLRITIQVLGTGVSTVPELQEVFVGYRQGV